MVQFKPTVLAIGNIDENSKKLLTSKIYTDIYTDHILLNIIFKDSIDNLHELLNILSDNRTVDCILLMNINDTTKNVFENVSEEILNKVIYVNNVITTNFIKNTVIPLIFADVQPYTKPLFSFYTCTYKSDKSQLIDLYKSMCNQTYKNWNWYIIDDSPDNSVSDIIFSFNDSRIIMFKNITNHASIGFNKHNIAMLCNGDWLLEVDHDDKLTKDCLETIFDAIKQFPKSKFIYSTAFEDFGLEYPYGNAGEFSHRIGYYKKEIIENKERNIATVGPLSSLALRSILCAPNHIRCVEREFYHKINGHNTNLAVIDDLDLIDRIFLNCNSIDEITFIDKTLYIQNLKSEHTTKKVNVIACDEFIIKKNDKKIHDKLISLGFKDLLWNESEQRSMFGPHIIDKVKNDFETLCNVYTPKKRVVSKFY